MSNTLTLRESADDILRKYYSKSKDVDTEVQKQYIIEAAARILKKEIKTSISESFKEHYPSPDKFSVAESVLYLPSTLQLLCRAMFVGNDKERKIGSIGQSMVQAQERYWYWLHYSYKT